MFILLLLLTTVAAQPFWITVELKNIVWRDGCITTALCSQPRFQVVKDLLPISERVSVNWPITEHFIEDSVRPFTSYWPSGRLEDISLSGQVVGTDRTYGFPRICDQTPSVRIFPERQQDMEIKSSSNEKLKEEPEVTILVKGKCFNATLTVVKHVERCPWCPDPQEVTVIGQETPDRPSVLVGSLFGSIGSEEKFVHIGVVVLAIVAVLSSSAFAFVLVLYLKHRRGQTELNVKPRLHPYITVKGSEDESRYDMPWEAQQTRPLTYWMGNKSDSSTITSPLDSSSSIRTTTLPTDIMTYSRDGYQTYRPPPIPAMPPSTHLFRQLSPDSNRYPDSGLGSV